MSRYILLNETGQDADAALAVLEDMPDVRLIDRTHERALLVEASPEGAEELGRRLAGWKVAAETAYDKPAPPFPRGRWKL
ncbi:MAG TPA: hypothetical protein VGW40_01385 [Allosphingosinicella sp.]|nr:hypothetical protein [Allosphingosinicella sp.]